jgi:hypothetical protein
MHVYRNRRYEEEIVMLMWHKKGEQRMIWDDSDRSRAAHRYLYFELWAML